MGLTLRIENHQSLPDGGPLSAVVTESGLEIGRDSSMGWTLPDPNRFISGRHLEIRFERGAFWLYDLSTNGTFLNGSTNRVKSPHRLESGDRLQVGPYRILVEAGAEAPAGAWGAAAPAAPPSARPDPFAAGPSARSGPLSAPGSGGDIWSLGAPSPAPVPGFDPRPVRRQGDYGDQHIEMPRMQDAAPHGAGASRAEAAYGGYPGAPAAQPTGGDAGSPFGAPVAPQPMPAPFVAAPMAPVAAPETEAFQPAQPPAAVPQPVGGAPAALLDAICAGAGLPPGSLSHGRPEETAAEIGRALRVVAEDLAALLRVRAATKHSVRSGQRTQIGASDNNPLKFMPGPDEALSAIFGAPRSGYMRGATAFHESFEDIKKHQYAVHAAMQPALARLLEDLAPEGIEAKAAGGVLGSKKARAWEIFVERWDAKTHPFENGMLDVFLAYFAESYDQATRKPR